VWSALLPAPHNQIVYQPQPETGEAESDNGAVLSSPWYPNRDQMRSACQKPGRERSFGCQLYCRSTTQD
jgi:hypothetical protein